jgi:hypothetical protein
VRKMKELGWLQPMSEGRLRSETRRIQVARLPTVVRGRCKSAASAGWCARAVLALACAAVVCCLAAACGSTQFEGNSIGFFPPGEVYTTNWKYMVQLYVETGEAGSMYRLQDKTVRIRVVDQSGGRLLDDEIDLRSCRVVGRSVWRDLDDLEVELVEEGSHQVDDPRSLALAESGPQSLMTLRYRYDAATGRFKRSP